MNSEINTEHLPSPCLDVVIVLFFEQNELVIDVVIVLFFEQNELPAGLNKKRLVALLKAFGEYPAKYRWVYDLYVCILLVKI